MKKLLTAFFCLGVLAVILLLSGGSWAVVEKYSRECDKKERGFDPEFCLKQRAGQLAVELLKERAQLRAAGKNYAVIKSEQLDFAKKEKESKKTPAELVKTKINTQENLNLSMEFRKDLAESLRTIELQSKIIFVLYLLLAVSIILTAFLLGRGK